MGMRDAFEANEVGILRARGAGISVELQFVPSDETCSELPAIAKWAVELGVFKLHLQYATSQGRNAGTPSLKVSDNHEPILRALALTLSREIPINFHISRLWCSKWGIPSDALPRMQIVIRSDGVVVRCNACKYIVEPVFQKNVYRETLREIWKDENWRNAPCECSTQRSGQAAAASRRSDMQVVRSHDLLTSGTK
jgi:MoaA/NifB/PqqE/SkfB family radical SAM enzyme